MPPDAGFWRIVAHHVRNGHLRAAGTEMLVGAIMLLCAGMLLQGASVSELRASNARVLHANAVLLQIADIDSEILGVELSVRGYALTDGPQYLRYYQTRSHHLVSSLNALGATLSDRPEEAARLLRLRRLIEARLQTFADLTARGPGQAAAIAQAIGDPAVRNTRTEAQRVLYRLRDDELHFLDGHQRRAETKVRQTYILSSAVMALAFVLAAVGLLLAFGGGAVPRDTPPAPAPLPENDDIS